MARNVFVNDYYRVNKDDFLPLRWLSPESAKNGIFSAKSDVWSFGMVLWEIMTLGELPYPTLNNGQVNK